MMAQTAGDARPRRARDELVGSLLLVLLTLVAYQPILTDRSGGFSFLNVDDFAYVVDNPQVKAGLTRESVGWALTSLHYSNWHPLTWMSLQLDCQLHGLAPWGFHLTNVLLHVASAVVLFLVFHRMTRALGRSLTVAALFAVHPLHVESVAWVAERKDVLSTFLSLLAMGAYVAYAARPSVLRYLPVALLMALGLTAKSMLVTLPCVFLLLDGWPLGRVRFGAPGAVAEGPPPFQRASPLRLVAEKLPLFALAAAGSVLNVKAQARMMNAMDALPLATRVENALVYYLAYIGRMVWPADLVVFRPNPGAALGAVPVVGSGLALAAFSVLAWRTARKRPYVPVGWLWYLGTLTPVIGLVQVGYLATADHYTYVPLIGLFLMAAWGGDELCAALPVRRPWPALAVVAILALCVGLTRHQLGYWRSSVALWQHVVDVTPDNAMAQAFFARSLEAAGRGGEAESHYALASELDTRWKDHEANGLRLEQAGDLWGARREFEAVLMVAPHDVTALEHLAVQFQLRGEIGDALKHYTTLARIQPTAAGPEYNLGLLYGQRGEVALSRAHLVRALELDPNLASARTALDALPAAASAKEP